MTDPTCPDCGATVQEDLSLSHEDGCPAGAAIDAMSAADREWFEAHPHASEYWRPLCPGDIGLSSLASIMCRGRVRVRQVSPGVRVRHLPADIVIPIHSLGDEVPSLDAEYAIRLLSDTPVLPDKWVQYLGFGGANS